ncbi:MULTISPECIES: GNAT family N-acetyltransferase [unclassified Mesorhizobium]|uniref:GNAT family N-acetyltransferase n=2 Tax=unclassified Mesorhizobium TaxID=325217 RepID=UPI001FE0CA67|nr:MULTISPECIES: GNAT family N-acetyltransferase [unclassified Mesorhizobium]MCT2576490.1 GNAT family N-acetyltransferase [Mesorhizobium sp. P13.3]MDF3164578.1 GNAT family N-acetyltransferase [Mesorhizobium sp. P16.1]
MDLSQIRISPFSSKDAIHNFRCGESDIDRWVSKAPKWSEQNKARLFLAHGQGNSKAMGFYSLSFSSEDRNKLAGKQDRQMWGSGVPLIYLQYLAVQRTCQNCGLGKMLLVDSLRRAHLVSKHVAFYGVGLRSLNDRTTALYSKYGFAVAPDEDKFPLMILPIWSINDLFEGRT